MKRPHTGLPIPVRRALQTLGADIATARKRRGLTLAAMAEHVPSFAGVAKRPNKFCHGYGIFQYDLQFFKEDPEYFLNREWRHFDRSLAKALEELKNAMSRTALAGRTTLSDLEQAHVAIAYNAGSFRPAKGLKQGFFDGEKFYGEMIFDFLRLSQTVSIPAAAGRLAVPAPGTAPGDPSSRAPSAGTSPPERASSPSASATACRCSRSPPPGAAACRCSRACRASPWT